jgi:heat shock protein HtpX
MKRKTYGRDAGLSLRILLTGSLLGLLYVIFAVVLFEVLSVGLIPMLVIVIGIAFFQYFTSDKLALAASGAKIVERDEAPELHDMIERLCAMADLPKPRVAIIDTDVPNAFATGRSPKHSAVAVTEGLITLMPREQVRGVLAHELAHIRNRDVLVTTIAAMIGAAISAIANFLQFQWLFGGNDDESPLGAIGSILAILVAPVAAMMLQLAVSRQREFLADATAAELLGEGRPLADALATLERGVQALPMQVNPATASLYIASPLSGKGVSSLFSTHPPIPVRIARLEAIDAARGGS